MSFHEAPYKTKKLIISFFNISAQNKKFSVFNQLDFNNHQFSKNNYNTRTVGLGIRISYNFKTRNQII